jgi:endonuclease III
MAAGCALCDPQERKEAPLRKAEKAQRIMEILEDLYPQPPIPLLHKDPFTLLVSTVLSAQTTDKKVNEVVPALFDVGGTPAELAKLEVEEIKEIIREVGLAPQKAKALKGLARKVEGEFHGETPQTMEELTSLPGVGRKTANVVLAQAFGQPAFPVDTHIFRLASRWGLSGAKGPDLTERDLCRTFPRERWAKLHLQIIYFGREHCPARGHDLSACRICSWAASKKRIEEERAANAPKRRAKGRKTGSSAGR